MCTRLSLCFEMEEYAFSTFIGQIQSITRACILCSYGDLTIYRICIFNIKAFHVYSKKYTTSIVFCSYVFNLEMTNSVFSKYRLNTENTMNTIPIACELSISSTVWYTEEDYR